MELMKTRLSKAFNIEWEVDRMDGMPADLPNEAFFEVDSDFDESSFH